jgi:formylglycine-generating enzyme required for sulfatase activity
VPFASAQAFCLWAGKRLPSAAEWEAAARYAPFTQRYYPYPWGEAYEADYAVGAETADDTLAVGSRSPAGDSPAGAADMAGNVAEWTATASGNDAVVKGGAYRDGAEELRATAAQFVPGARAEPWLGFRCAR